MAFKIEVERRLNLNNSGSDYDSGSKLFSILILFRDRVKEVNMVQRSYI